MDDIDIEISAIEELISLQRQKVELLRKKRSQASSSDALAEERQGSNQGAGIEMRDSIHNTSPPAESTAFTAVVNTIHDMIHEDAKVERGVGNNGDTDAAVATELKKSFWERVAPSFFTHEGNTKKILKNSQKEERFVDALTRLSRLTTDLANERTFLAWIRTALASARTVVSFLALEGTTSFGRGSVKTCVIGFAVLSLVMLLQGTERYRKIKEVLMTKDTPAGFDRLSTAPMSFCMIGVFFIVVIATASEEWVN